MLDEHLIGRLIRASRARLQLRQADLAAIAQVSRDVISKLENGRLTNVRVPELDRIASACRLRLRVDLVAARGDLDRLADGAHAYLVDRVAALLQNMG